VPVYGGPAPLVDAAVPTPGPPRLLAPAYGAPSPPEDAAVSEPAQDGGARDADTDAETDASGEPVPMPAYGAPAPREP
jgi:hypothetical protein